MIHHISIPARDTRHVAEVLVELFDGLLTGFGPYRDSWIAWAADDMGAAIEVYPVGTEMYPPDGPGQARFRHDPTASGFTATHATVSVQRTADEIVALARREGWRAVRLSRGPHEVIEFWIENRVMLEVMTPEMTADYLAAAPRRRGAARTASTGTAT
jgi:hypothetical protein